jgi:quinol monooxygenase YgiN
MEEKIAAENKLRVESEERDEMMAQLKKLNEEIDKNEQNLKVYERNDPIRIKKLENTTKQLLRLEEMVIYL